MKKGRLLGLPFFYVRSHKRTVIPMRKIRIAIAGASGYAGAELVRLVTLHPHFELIAVTSEKSAGVTGWHRVPQPCRIGLVDLSITRAGNPRTTGGCRIPGSASYEIIGSCRGLYGHRKICRRLERRLSAERSGCL